MEIAEKKLRDAILRGTELMIDHDLGDWRVMLQRKRTTLADCNFATKTIRYSEHFITVATREQFDGVTLHEIAHALVGKGHGHDAAWRRKCAEISPTKDYARSRVDILIPRYKLTCSNCGHIGAANKSGKPIYCEKCWTNTKEMIEFTVETNVLEVVVW